MTHYVQYHKMGCSQNGHTSHSYSQRHPVFLAARLDYLHFDESRSCRREAKQLVVQTTSSGHFLNFLSKQWERFTAHELMQILRQTT